MKKNIKELLLDLKKFDNETYLHSLRVGKLAYMFSNFLNIKNNENINLREILIAGYLHDIGKIFLKEEIFFKPNLTDVEFNHIKEHPLIGFKYLLLVNPVFSKEIYSCVLLHHLGYDKKGYPQNLSNNENIEYSLCVEIITIIDIFDALYNKRFYKESLTIDNVFKEMDNMINKQINLNLYKKFKKFINEDFIKEKIY